MKRSSAGLTFAVLLFPASGEAAGPAAQLAAVDHGKLVLVDGRAAPRHGSLRMSATPTRSSRASTTAARALTPLRAALGPTWIGWDEATGVPRRLLTAGTDATDSVADPWIAADLAKAWLADHIAVLAPGSRADDFVLVANHVASQTGGDMRSIGLVQYDHGREVLGGQVSFRFTHDRLVGIGSEALPFVDAPIPARRIDSAVARRSAEDFVDASVEGRSMSVGTAESPFVLPILDPATAPHYVEVLAVDVRVTGPDSAWRVYIDSETGDPVAREQTLSFASGNVLYNAPQRSPSFGTRADDYADRTEVLVHGGVQLTDGFGTVSFPNPTAAVLTQLIGPDRQVFNAAGETAVAEPRSTSSCPARPVKTPGGSRTSSTTSSATPCITSRSFPAWARSTVRSPRASRTTCRGPSRTTPDWRAGSSTATCRCARSIPTAWSTAGPRTTARSTTRVASSRARCGTFASC